MSLSAGDRLGRYEVLAPLGAGGMGEVYRARDTELEREVAVKVLPEALAENPDRLDRFSREAKAVAKLSHPNILEIWDFGTEGDITYSVTELLEGETLRERLEGGALGWRKATEIGAAIADGVAAAHEAGIVHRDLKPSNVFLTADGRVKVLDFGLARHDSLEEEESATHAPTLTKHTDPGTVLGTAGYMSPEQVKGETVDHRSDIFSLGCVLYEMVSGRRAFARDTAVETMNAILKEEPENALTAGDAIPPELAGTIRRCLEKRPESRFQSASDLAYNLRSLSSASAASPGAAPRRWGVGWRSAALLLSVVVVFAIVLVWLNPGGWRSRILTPGAAAGPEHIDSLAVLPFVNVGGDEDTEYLSDGIPASVIDRLSRLSALRVVPRSTAFHFREQEYDLSDVGRQLNVEAILVGEVRVRDETLVIRVELVDVGTDRQLWGERITGTLEDILDTEEQIATRVSESLRIELSREERTRLASRGTSNPEAYRHYLQGRYHRETIVGDSLRKAVESYSAAIEQDPTFALAYWGLAESLLILADRGWEPLENVLPRARNAVKKALALDDSLAEAHGALALLSEYDWDPVTAEREYHRALELDPGAVDVRHQWAWFLALQGRFEEAITEIQTILETDPLSRRANRALVNFLFSAHQTEEAMEQLQHAQELDPDSEILHRYKGQILAGQKRYDEALAELERPSSERNIQLKHLGWTYARAGRINETHAVLDELNQQDYVPPVYFAFIYAGLGDNDQAFEWLERGLAERDPSLLYLRQWPEWDPIRDDPRFAELIRRIPYYIED